MPITVGPGVPALASWARMYCMPVEPELFGDIADRSAAATPANVKGKSLGVEWIVREEVETLALHLTALAAPNAPHLELQKYAQAASRKVANSADLAVVPSGMFSSACAAGCFFERQTRAMMQRMRIAEHPAHLVHR